MADGTFPATTHQASTEREPETVFAQHGKGYDQWGGCWQTTFLFADKACKRPLGWVRGFYPDGHVLRADAGIPARRLVLVEAQ